MDMVIDGKPMEIIINERGYGMLNARIKRAYKGFKIETKEIIMDSVIRYVLSNCDNKRIELHVIIPKFEFPKCYEAEIKLYGKVTEFLDGLGFWRND